MHPYLIDGYACGMDKKKRSKLRLFQQYHEIIYDKTSHQQ